MAEGKNIERYLRRSDISKMLGVSQSTIGRMVAKGKLPPGISLSSHCRVWRVSDLEEAIAKMERETAPALPSVED